MAGLMIWTIVIAGIQVYWGNEITKLRKRIEKLEKKIV